MRVIETIKTCQCPRCGKTATRCRCDLKKSIRQRTKCVFSYIYSKVDETEEQASNEAPKPQSSQLTIENTVLEMAIDDDKILAENNIICPRCAMNLKRSQKSADDPIDNIVCQHCLLRAQIYKLKAEKRKSRLRSHDHTKRKTNEDKLEIIYMSKKFQEILTESKPSREKQDAVLERIPKKTELDVFGKLQKCKYSPTELNYLRPKSMPAKLQLEKNQLAASSSQEIMSYRFPITSKKDIEHKEVISSELIRCTREKCLGVELKKKQNEPEVFGKNDEVKHLEADVKHVEDDKANQEKRQKQNRDKDKGKKKAEEEAEHIEKKEKEVAVKMKLKEEATEKKKKEDERARKKKADVEIAEKKRKEEKKLNKEQQTISNIKENTETTKKEKIPHQDAKHKIKEDTSGYKEKKDDKGVDEKQDRVKRQLQTESELMILKLIKEYQGKKAEERIFLAQQKSISDMAKKKLEAERKKQEDEQAAKTKEIEETFTKRTLENLLAASSAALDEPREYKAVKIKKSKITDIIIGETICQSKLPLPPDPLLQDVKEPITPSLFKTKSVFSELLDAASKDDTKQKDDKPKEALTIGKKESKDGIIKYALSDRSFIENGWTVLPVEEVVRKMHVYRMRPAQPEFDWFEHNKSKGHLEYATGEKLALFDDNGGCRWYYKNGRLALDYYNSEELHSQHRFVVYSNGEPDERGRSRPYTVLATFSHLGTGVVFDHGGKIRLKYNQTEGVLLDREIGPVTTWKWHSLNDPPVLRQVMIDSKLIHKDPTILRLGEKDDHHRKEDDFMIAVENENSLREMQRKQSLEFKPFQIKAKSLKINENFSLKVLDQTTIYLIFREGSAHIKLNIGMLLDHHEIVDTDTTSLGVVSNCVEQIPAATDSIAALQRSVEHAKRFERNRTARDRLTRPPLPKESADRLVAGLSRPLKVPLRTLSTSQTASKVRCSRKPSCNLYYNSRLPC